MKTVGQIAKQFGLSRSALLYYASIGLVRPSGRSAAGYRLYSESDCRQLETVLAYRDAKIPLKEISNIMQSDSVTHVREILEKRLLELNREMSVLQKSRNLLIGLLQGEQREQTASGLTRDGLVSLFETFGFNERDRQRWHYLFEQQSPEVHRDFLESIGISSEETERIRGWARSFAADVP